MVTCPNEVANQLGVVHHHLLQPEIQAEISNPEHAPGSYRFANWLKIFLKTSFNLFVSPPLCLSMSQLLPKSLNGGTGSWAAINFRQIP